jgi:hypothetical protein
MELQVERGLHEGEKRGGSCMTIIQAPSARAKDILKAKRASLADEIFEMFMFMRSNKHHITIFLRIF